MAEHHMDCCGNSSGRGHADLCYRHPDMLEAISRPRTDPASNSRAPTPAAAPRSFTRR